jgi:hypothetical protein
MRRNRYLEEILQLDPRKDHERIAFLDTSYEFPWDTTRSLEMALFRTFASASGSAVLERTGEFIQRPQKRYDDTVLILSEILENGYDSPRGRAALRRMNQMHGRYPISNQDFLYVLSTFIYEPIRWNARFGWRKLTETEKLASFYYWRQIGKFMNIHDIPEDYDAFEQFNVRFEQEHFAFAPSNQRVAAATRELFLSWFLPKPLRRFGEPVVHAMLDDRLREAVGFPKAPGWLRRLVEVSLKLRGWVVRWLPRRSRPRLITQQKNRTYPDGYEIEELGTR